MEPSAGGTLRLRSHSRSEALDITPEIQAVVTASGVADGLCVVYVPHTTAAVFINENADPDALADILAALDRMVPWEAGYAHAEGNAAAHIKATLIGSSQTIPVNDRRLALGRWQGVFFAEFDGPRERQYQVTMISK
ncbi:MAG: secondary thiamine-phosphate synthase enzyme YjbQ [Candidatus Dormibacteria bacterium]